MVSLLLVHTVVIAAVAFSSSLSPGDHLISIRVTNDTIIHVPPRYDASHPIPVMLALHGLGDNYPDLFQKDIGMDAVADNETFVVVYPLGSKSVSVTMFGHTWNGGNCCFSSADDLGYLKQVVERTAALVKVDRSRVYSMGFSAGGVMSHTLACRAADTFAAVVSIDGPIEVKGDCLPSRPVPVMHFHGTLDPVFPYGGALYNGAPQTFKAWQTADKCIGDPANSTLAPRVTLETCMSGTGAEVQLATVHNGFHSMPPKVSRPEQLIWNFLSRWKISETVVAPWPVLDVNIVV